MKRLIVLLTGLGILMGCNNALKAPTPNIEEKIAASTLINELNNFNSKLSTETRSARLYDVKTNKISISPQTRFNWRSFFYADAIGGFWGGKAAGKYGLIASGPSGGVAAAVIGGLLVGVASSGLDAWIQGGDRTIEDDETNIDYFVSSGNIYSPSKLLNFTKKIVRLEKYEGPYYEELEIDSTLQMAGVLHNVLLDQMLKPTTTIDEEVSMSNSRSSTEVSPESDGQDEIYNFLSSDFAEQLVSSADFENEYSAIVEDLFQKIKNGVLLEEATSLLSCVENLFLEASMISSDDPDALTKIANYYYQTIQPSSELSEDEKTAIYVSMVIAVYSKEYWTKRGNQ